MVRRLRHYVVDGGVEGDKIGVVPVGVNTTRFSGVSDGLRRRAKGRVLNATPRTFVILTMMPLETRTRPHLILSMLQLVLQDVSSVPIWDREIDDVLVVVVGMGDLFESFQAQIRAEGLSDQVRLLPAISKPETYMRAADIFFYPASSQSLPLSMAEAMSVGLPVIAPGGSALGELLASSKSQAAVLLDFKNRDAHDARVAADAVLDMAFDSKLRERTGAAAAKLMQSRFDRAKASKLLVSERQQALSAPAIDYEHDKSLPNPATAFGLLYLAVKDRLVSDVGVVQSRLAEVRCRGLSTS